MLTRTQRLKYACKLKKKKTEQNRKIQKSQLNRVRRPEGGALMPWDNSRAQKE